MNGVQNANLHKLILVFLLKTKICTCIEGVKNNFYENTTIIACDLF